MTNENTTAKDKQRVKRQFEGEVVSAAEAKTIHVRVKSVKLHPKYRKHYTAAKKYAVHDEKREAHFGDLVSFVECRPLSRTKRWRLLKVIKCTNISP